MPEASEYRINSIEFRSGLKIRPGALTLLVGPNNSGKSQTLRELSTWAVSRHGARTPGKIVASVTPHYPTDVKSFLQRHGLEPRSNGSTFEMVGLDHRLAGATPSILSDSWDTVFAERGNYSEIDLQDYFASTFGSYVIAFLTTEQRLQLANSSGSSSDYYNNLSLLQLLYRKGSAAERNLSKRIYDAFRTQLALDYSSLQSFSLKVGDGFDQIPPDPRDARPLMELKESLEAQGDGIRSFAGILLALEVVKRSVFLIDEPEAFLHPPQAFRMGAQIAEHAEVDRQIIVATHSADFLRGILSKTTDVQIIRLDRVNDTPKSSVLLPDRLKGIVNSPLLTSSRVLDGIFYQSAVVTESDSDARLYQSAISRQAGDLDVHFVRADNKQTVAHVLCLYREMGIRSAGIVDIDIANRADEVRRMLENLHSADEVISSILADQSLIAKSLVDLPIEAQFEGAREALGMLLSQLQAMTTDQEKERAMMGLTGDVRKIADAGKPWQRVKREGRDCLPANAQAAFDRLSVQMANLGLFVLPTGELETLLKDYGIPYTSDKRAWIVQALTLVPALGVDLNKQPWKFLSRVIDYLKGA